MTTADYLRPLADLNRPTHAVDSRPLDADRRVTYWRDDETGDVYTSTEDIPVDAPAEPVRVRVPGPRRLAEAVVVPLLASLGWEILDANRPGAPVGERETFVRRVGNDGDPRPLRDGERERLADRVITDLADLDLDAEPIGSRWRTSYYVPALVGLATCTPERLRPHVLDAIGNAWRVGKPWRRPRPASPSEPRHRDETEHKRRQRARLYLRRDDAARWALAVILGDVRRYVREDAISGARVKAPALWSAARDLVESLREAHARAGADESRYRREIRAWLRDRQGPRPTEPERWDEIAERYAWPEPDNVPPSLARDAFYAVADAVLGARVRGTAGVGLYVVPALLAEIHEDITATAPLGPSAEQDARPSTSVRSVTTTDRLEVPA